MDKVYVLTTEGFYHTTVIGVFSNAEDATAFAVTDLRKEFPGSEILTSSDEDGIFVRLSSYTVYGETNDNYHIREWRVNEKV